MAVKVDDARRILGVSFLQYADGIIQVQVGEGDSRDMRTWYRFYPATTNAEKLNRYMLDALAHDINDAKYVLSFDNAVVQPVPPPVVQVPPPPVVQVPPPPPPPPVVQVPPPPGVAVPPPPPVVQVPPPVAHTVKYTAIKPADLSDDLYNEAKNYVRLWISEAVPAMPDGKPPAQLVANLASIRAWLEGTEIIINGIPSEEAKQKVQNFARHVMQTPAI